MVFHVHPYTRPLRLFLVRWLPSSFVLASWLPSSFVLAMTSPKICHILLRPYLSKSGVMQHVQVWYSAHHDVSHFGKFLPEERFSVEVRNVQVSVDLEHVNST